MAITLTYGHANGATSTLAVTGLTISVGFSAGVISIVSGATDPVSNGSCVDNGSSSNTYSRKATFFDAGDGFTVESFAMLNAANSATSMTYTPPNVGTIFSDRLAVWVMDPNGGIITYADQKTAHVFSTTTGTNAVATANVLTTTANSLILAMGTDTVGATLSAGTLFTADIPPAAPNIAEHQFVSSAAPAQWTDSAAGHYAIMAALGFDWVAPAAPSRFPPFGIGAIAPLAWVIRRRQIRAKERNSELRQWKRDETSGLIVPEYKKTATLDKTGNP